MNGQSLFHVWFEVPNGLLDVEGNDGTIIPFGDLRPVRYQQVCDGSQFSQLPAGGAFVTRIFLKPDCGSNWDFVSTNLQLNLSTTAKGPDQLSAVFAENIGPDETVVWRRSSYFPPSGGSPCPNSFSMLSEFYLDVPFFYDPAKGNLLLDLRKTSTEQNDGWPPPRMDAQTVLGDSVSRAFAFSLNTNMAEVVDTTGLLLQFEFFPTPTLNVGYETNNVVLRWMWTTQPQTFRPQWSDQLGLAANWANYPGAVDQRAWDYKAIIPASSLAARKFFRLFWDTPQPLVGALATTPLQVESTKNP